MKRLEEKSNEMFSLRQKVKFLLAYKAKGAAGHYYCSDKCARDANTDALTSRSAVEVYRGGPLELFIFCFLLPWWFCKLFFKLGRSFFKIAKPILKNKWVWTIFFLWLDMGYMENVKFHLCTKEVKIKTN